MYFIVVTVFVVTAGVSLDNARQIFDDTLAGTIDTIETGSLLRQGAFLVLGAWGVISLVTNGVGKVRLNPVVAIPLMGFLAVAGTSVLWAIDRDLTVRRVAVLALVALAAFAFGLRVGIHGLAKMTLVVAGVTVVGATAAQVVVGPLTPFDGEWRFGGILHPVALSWFCGLGAIAATALIREYPRRRALLLTAVLLFLVALVLTRTRTSVLGAALGLLSLYLLSRRNRGRLIMAIALILAGSFLTMTILAAAMGLSWSSSLRSLVDVTSLGRPDAVEQIDTFTGRLPVWEASVQLAGERPLLGYGYNSFSSSELLGEFAHAAGWVPTSAHSGYIESFLSLGITGLVLLLGLLVGGVWSSLRLAKRRPEYSFAAASLIWLGVLMVFEAPVFYEPMYTAFLAYGLLFVLAFSHEAVESGRAQPFLSWSW